MKKCLWLSTLLVFAAADVTAQDTAPGEPRRDPPPSAAFVEVLREVVGAIRDHDPDAPLALLTRGLPRAVPDAILEELSILATDDLCVGTQVIVFSRSERIDAGAFEFEVLAGPVNTFLMPIVFHVACSEDNCSATRAPGPIADHGFICAGRSP